MSIGPALAQEVTHHTYVIQPPNLSQNESISRFEVHIDAGGVEGVTGLPMGWTITIDNDGSLNTKAEGSFEFESVALDPNQLKKIQFHLMGWEPFKGFPKFGLSGSLEVDDFVSDRDRPKERKIILGPGNFELVK